MMENTRATGGRRHEPAFAYGRRDAKVRGQRAMPAAAAVAAERAHHDV